jgi:hypothetical protein
VANEMKVKLTGGKGKAYKKKKKSKLALRQKAWQFLKKLN